MIKIRQIIICAILVFNFSLAAAELPSGSGSAESGFQFLKTGDSAAKPETSGGFFDRYLFMLLFSYLSDIGSIALGSAAMATTFYLDDPQYPPPLWILTLLSMGFPSFYSCFEVTFFMIGLGIIAPLGLLPAQIIQYVFSGIALGLFINLDESRLNSQYRTAGIVSSAVVLGNSVLTSLFFIAGAVAGYQRHHSSLDSRGMPVVSLFAGPDQIGLSVRF
jgi:hypothetical protein